MKVKEQRHPYEFTKMVIAGGAMRSLASIGCIRYLEEENLLKSIKHFAGTSAGSVICLFLVLGYTANEIFEFIITNFKRNDVASVSIEDIFKIIDNFGLNLGANITAFIGTMLHQKLKVKDITFLELAKNTGKNLVVCVANLTKHKEEYWCVDTTPSMSVIKAIRASCSLPILFTPVKHNGDLYIDGGIYNNFPIDYFCGTQHNDTVREIKDIIGINVVSNPPPDNQDFLSYISMIFHTIINRLGKPVHNDLHNNIVTLQFEDEAWLPVSGLQVVVSREMLETYTSIGYTKMKELLQQYDALLALNYSNPDDESTP
jgi:predicted acylesterase/phospholipase RssA